MQLDLKTLEENLDKALSNETNEGLTGWLQEKRLRSSTMGYPAQHTELDHEETLETEWEKYWEEYRIRNPNTVGGFMKVYPGVRKKFFKNRQNKKIIEQTLNSQLDIIETIKSELNQENLKFIHHENSKCFYLMMRNETHNLETICVMKSSPLIQFAIFLSNGSKVLDEWCKLPSQGDAASYQAFYDLIVSFISKSKELNSKV